MKSKYLSAVFIGVIILITLYFLSPLFEYGFFPMHDDTQVARVHQMTKSLRDGMFPVRWVSDLGYGYGYPIFNFYAPFAYYVGSIFDLAGFDELTATKIMMAVPFIILGIGMYLLSSSIFGKSGGVVSAIFAISSPYFAVNLFVRGAVAELYGIAFLPLIFYSFIQIVRKKQFRYVIVGGISFAGMIVSHNLTALMATPFILVSIIILFIVSFREHQKVVSVFLVYTLVIGVLLSAFYWLPAIFEIDYSNVRSQVGGGADFRDHYICPFQLWDSPWGFGGSTVSCTDGMSFRLGKVHIGLLLLVLPLIVFVKERFIRFSLIGGYCVFFSALFLSLQFSRPIWEIITPLEFIQYPWRFLGLMSVSAAFVAGGIVLYPRLLIKTANVQKIVISSIVLILVLSSFFFYSKLFKPQVVLDVTSSDYTSLDIIQFKTSRLSDEYMPAGFEKPLGSRSIVSEPLSVVNGDTSFTTGRVSTDYISSRASTVFPSVVLINTAYYPAWHIFVNGIEVPYKKDKRGMIIELPKGEHVIEAVYKSTPIQIGGNILSIVGIGVLIVAIILEHKRKLL